MKEQELAEQAQPRRPAKRKPPEQETRDDIFATAPSPRADSTTIAHRKIEELIVPPLQVGRPYLIVIKGRAVGRMLEVAEGESVLGRSMDSALALEDAGVSRQHARLSRHGRRVLIEDLGSRNGVFVNGERIERCLLHDGDRIQLGASSVLKFALQDEVEEAYRKTLFDAATRDPLVGTYNRRHFVETLAADFVFYTTLDRPLSLLLLDLDNFKRINDTHGHLGGDYALKEVASLVQRGLRTEDVLARYGGEEFVLLLRGIASDGALHVAERVRTNVAEHTFRYGAAEFGVSLSIGVATQLGGRYASPDALLEAADRGLYEAKRGGRNRCVVF